MTAVTRTRPAGRRPLLHLALLAFALLLGAGLALAPQLAATGAIVVGLVTLVALRPAAGATVLILASLLLGGIERGVLIPLLRPQEAVLGLVVVALLLSVLMGVVSGRHRLAFRFDRLDVVLLAMAFFGSVVPIAVMLWRDEPKLELDDVLYALQLWKFYAVFLVVRIGVRTAEEVGRLLWFSMAAAVVVGVTGVLQSLGLFGVDALMATYFRTSDTPAANVDLDRATSTVSSPFAVGDIMTFACAIAAGLLVRGHPRRLLLSGLAGLFLFCAIASGQFSIVIGILVAAVAFGLLHRKLGRAVVALLVVGLIGSVALQPVIENRTKSFNNSSGLPQSWQGRLFNLETFFLPVLEEDSRWITGVRPSARVPTDLPWYDGYVWIESGYVWLLWTGGIGLFALFWIFLIMSMRRMARVARARDDPIGVAASASFTALAVIGVLMTLDVHLTLRGAGELIFALLALGHPRPPEDLP